MPGGAIFDVDCDGVYANDIELSISHFVSADYPEFQGPLLPNTQHNIGQVDSVGEGVSNVGVISASIDGSQLILTANRDDYSGLANINSKTPVRFATYFYSAGTVYTDNFPNSADSYTSTN